jgi:hypothetical protein
MEVVVCGGGWEGGKQDGKQTKSNEKEEKPRADAGAPSRLSRHQQA